MQQANQNLVKSCNFEKAIQVAELNPSKHVQCYAFDPVKKVLAVCYAEGTIVVYGISSSEVVLKHHAFKKKRFISAQWHSGKFCLLVLTNCPQSGCFVVDCAASCFAGFIRVTSADDEKNYPGLLAEISLNVSFGGNYRFVSGGRNDLNFSAAYDDKGMFQFIDISSKKSVSVHSLSSPNSNDRICFAAFHPADSKFMLFVLESGFIIWWDMIEQKEDESKRFEAHMKILVCDVDATGAVLSLVSHAGEIFALSLAKKSFDKLGSSGSNVVKSLLATTTSKNAEVEIMLHYIDDSLELRCYNRSEEDEDSFELLYSKKCESIASFHVLSGSAWLNGHSQMRGVLALTSSGEFRMFDDGLNPVSREVALFQLQFHPSLFFSDAADHKNTCVVSDAALIDSLLVDLESICMSSTSASSSILLEGGRTFESESGSSLGAKKSIMVLNQKTCLIFILVGQSLPKIIYCLSYEAVFDSADEYIENYQINWISRVLVAQTNTGNIFVHVFDFVGDAQEEQSLASNFLFKQLARTEQDIGFFCKFKIFIGSEVKFSYYFAGYDLIVCHCAETIHSIDLKNRSVDVICEMFHDNIISVDLIQLDQWVHLLLITSEKGVSFFELLKNFTGGLQFVKKNIDLGNGDTPLSVLSVCAFDKLPDRNINPAPVEYSVGIDIFEKQQIRNSVPTEPKKQLSQCNFSLIIQTADYLTRLDLKDDTFSRTRLSEINSKLAFFGFMEGFNCFYAIRTDDSIAYYDGKTLKTIGKFCLTPEMTTYQVLDGYLYSSMADGSIGIFSHFISEKPIQSIKCLASNNLLTLQEKPKQEASWFRSLLTSSNNDIEKLNSTYSLVESDAVDMARFQATKNRLVERGDKLNELDKEVSSLKSNAKSFADLAKEVRENLEKKAK